MANNTNTTKPTQTKKSTVQNNVVNESVETNKDKETIDALQKQIEELKQMLMQKEQVFKEEPVEDVKISDIPEEPNPNKQIRLISLYYGELNLSTEPFGRGKIVSFSKYGEVKNVLYNTLIDIVNNNRKFSENGYYYILDKNAVYHLGLAEYYEDKILTKEILDNICNYSKEEIEDILSNASEEQKDVLIHNLVNKIYNNKPVDLNKCDVISKYCNVDIMAKVSEMREVQKNIENKK